MKPGRSKEVDLVAAAAAVIVRTGGQAVGDGHLLLPVPGLSGNQKAASKPPFLFTLLRARFDSGL